MPIVVDPVIGRCIGGDFDVQRLIAAGGVGSVYEAVQRSTGKSRAVKLMHGWLLRDERMRGRFIDEARAAGSIDSDHVVEVLSSGIDPELGLPWIAMELLRGHTLAEHVERFGAMSRADCLEVLAQARHGLQYAHERQLVHRDLKPENIFVADARRVGVPFTIKILDFGIAKWVHDVRGGDQNSQVIGTPSWMAPEQLSNATSITPATDVWALGLLAFWLLTGSEYWVAANDEQGTVSSVLLEVVSGPTAKASERAAQLGGSRSLPAGFDAWFASAVALDPGRRFRDAASCIDALEPVLAFEHAAVPRSGVAYLAAVMPNTSELEVAFDDAISSRARRADWSAHAATAAQAHSSDVTEAMLVATPRAPRPTARRLSPDDIRGPLFAGSAATHGFTDLAELLGAGLASNPTAPESAGVRAFPDRIQEAVRHVSLVLGVNPPPALIEAEGEGESFVLQSMAPPVLGVGARLRAVSSDELLRAHAAVAVGRTLPPFLFLASLASAEALESARKAAVALARGTVSNSPHFRRLVGKLGPRRAELAKACELAEPVSADEYFRASVFTLARLARLCSADEDAAVAAVVAQRFTIDENELRAHLVDFAASPIYQTYWHRGGA